MIILATISALLGIQAITASPITERQRAGAPFVDLQFGPTCDPAWWNRNNPSILTLDNYTASNCVIIDGFPGNFKIKWSVGASNKIGWCMVILAPHNPFEAPSCCGWSRNKALANYPRSEQDADCMGADGKGTCWEQGVNDVLENGGCVDVEGWIQSMYILLGDGSDSS